jgi:hypothetical protein
LGSNGKGDCKTKATPILAHNSGAIGLATIFLIRTDLERHSNEREPYGLQLGGVMTFFFSFIYFQYHLNEIAKRRRENRAGDPDRTLCP